MNRYVCIHGHYYQPPRENPWTGVVERQESAAPWHDWNGQITSQCYGPNGSARILDEKGRVVAMRNCYGSISFNVGPTLLSWLESKCNWVYRAVLDADRIGAVRFGGHGPAMAQVYGHAIMPLASERDKRTQTLWGISDFRRRFKRDPEGIWLAETAVDVPTLEVLSSEGIKFTVLAPHQAGRIASDGPLDITVPYRCLLPSGRDIALFFYDGKISQEIAFGGALDNGRALARRMIDACPDLGSPALEHVAVDGETFGHHHRFGDMALAACLDELDRAEDVKLTVYGEFLEICPPSVEVEVVERSTWSCSHGVERWRSDCGCSDGGHAGWHQKWRGPLRTALEGLRDGLDRLYSLRASALFPDPWGTRDRGDYLALPIARKDRVAFLNQEAQRELSLWETAQAMTLLEIQRCSLLMFSSCGWFFDDLSRVESIQILKYAAKALDLAESLGETSLRGPFLAELESAPSNVPELSDGRRVFSCFVEPCSMDLPRVGAHMALYDLFNIDPGETEFPHIWTARKVMHRGSSGDLEYCTGCMELHSDITGRSSFLAVGALWFGGRKMLCGSVPLSEGRSPDEVVKELTEVVAQGSQISFQEVFGHRVYSLRHLFKDSRDRIFQEVQDRCEDQMVKAMKPVVAREGNMIDPNGKEETPLGLALRIVSNRDIAKGLMDPDADYVSISKAISLARRRGVTLDQYRIERAARIALAALCKGLEEPLSWREYLEKVPRLLDLLDQADASVDMCFLQRIILTIVGKGEMSPEIQAIASRIGISLDGISGLTHSPDLQS